MINDTTAVIPVKPDNPHPLGRYGVHHDPQNALHRALVRPGPRAAIPYKVWNTMTVFDQGNTSRCTTEAAVGLMRTTPFAASFKERPDYDTGDERQALYKYSQTFDPWPGEDYDGSSTDAPFKVLRERGVITSWKWLFGEDELREYVTWYGPAVVGTVWLEEMFNPLPDEYLSVAGGVAGGHAYRIVQFSKVRNAYRIVNSWGKGWGRNGRAWISQVDMARLLADEGEAVTLG